MRLNTLAVEIRKGWVRRNQDTVKGKALEVQISGVQTGKVKREIRMIPTHSVALITR